MLCRFKVERVVKARCELARRDLDCAICACPRGGGHGAGSAVWMGSRLTKVAAQDKMLT